MFKVSQQDAGADRNPSGVDPEPHSLLHCCSEMRPG